MSLITKPPLLDETGKELVAGLHTQNALLNVIAGLQLEKVTSLEEIGRIVASGNAKKVFNPGDQIIVPWKDVTADKTYQMVFGVRNFIEAELQNGEKVPGMIIQADYAHPFGVQFSQYQAFYRVKTREEDGENGGVDLAPGTYCIQMGATWGTYVKKDEYFNFTLTQAVPVGGILEGFHNAPDKASTEWNVRSFINNTATNPIETVKVAAGKAGKLLGVLLPSNSGELSLHRTAYGNNRYRDSAIRQYLNSAGGVNEWWNPQHNYDRPPDQLATKAGFLSGFDEDFLSLIKPTKVVTALNTVSDGGTADNPDITYDKFFLPSLEEMHCAPQIAGEGEVWPYWSRASESKEPLAQYGTYPQMRTFGLENKTNAQSVRLRSAFRGNAYGTWYVYASGYVNYSSALYANRFAPACVLIGQK